MSKSIVLFFNHKPFGVFSNKTNAWMAVEANFDVAELFVWSDKKNAWLPASYGLMAQRFAKGEERVTIFDRQAIDAATEEAPVKPCIVVYQYITNKASDGNWYLSKEKGESVEVDGQTEQTEVIDNNEGVLA
jgi:hypothetical protein